MAIFQPSYYVTIVTTVALLGLGSPLQARAADPAAIAYEVESANAVPILEEEALPDGGANDRTLSADAEVPAENMDDPALVKTSKTASALPDSALPECPSDATTAKRTCYDGVFDSLVAAKICYSRTDDEGCRSAFQRCLQRCGYEEAPPRHNVSQATGAPRENRIMAALERRIREMTRRPTCTEDGQCGLYELKSPDGCPRFGLFSERALNVRALQQLVRSYNNAAMLFFADAACPNAGGPTPGVICARTEEARTGECVIKEQERPN